MTAAGVNLSDLNIVSIAPTPKVQPIKRKKNNKYERRRQKAQRSRQQREKTDDDSLPKREGADEIKVDVPANEDISNHENQTPTGHDEPVIVSPSGEKEEAPTVDVVETAESKTTRKNDARISSTSATPVPAKHTEPKETKTEIPSEPAKNESSAQPSRRQKSKFDEATDIEHAKYMAEFHARPMELDRRSGARRLANVSKASSHLFVQADNWESLGLHERLIHTLSNKFGAAKPTGIQSHTIQTVQKNQQHNVLVHSETGSGKTLAYLLPVLQKLAFHPDGTLKKQSRKDLGTKCIILCPTRELASQTLVVVEKLCQANFAGWMVPGGLLGGDSRSSEKSRLRKGLAIVVATPGRLLDHLNKTESLLLNLKGNLEWLVLDEADRLLDMGLGDQVRQIVQLIRANEASKSQAWWRSILVSATVTQSVQELAKERMLCGDQQWIWVKGGKGKANNGPTQDGSAAANNAETEDGFADSTPRQLAQFHITVTAKLRLSTLISFLVQRVMKGERTVVFMGTCATVDYHYELFQSLESLWDDNKKQRTEDDTNKNTDGLFGNKARVFKLHGSVQHSQRNQTLRLFDAHKDGGAILLSTDVAARGLNLHGIDWTVQYDPPCELADYVHRVGRVARAGKAGHSLLFLLPSERGYLDVLQTKGVSTIQAMSLSTTLNQAASHCPNWTKAGLRHGGTKEDIDQEPEKKRRPGTGRSGEHFAAEVQRRLEDCVVQDDQEAKKKWKEQQRASKKKRGRITDSKKEGRLLELARDAFMSFLRAYPTKKEPSVRAIFSARALHLGHIARSFALKEPPKSLASQHKQLQSKNDQKVEDATANKSRSLGFERYENNLVTFSDDEEGDNRNDEDETNKDQTQTRTKRVKRHHPAHRLEAQDGRRAKNAKTLLLANARKMQTNLMDAM